MPSVLIEIRKNYSKSEEIALMDALHGALVDSFKIKPTDKTIRLVVHEPHRFAHPPTLTQPEFFTHITINAFTGRTLEAKRNLYQAIVARLGAFGIPSDHILILLQESPLDNWGVRGGQAACDIDLGFKVNI
ncbi:tautomerase family protein [Polynucleobacter sp. JS-Safj-400b-B2]|uniref:tautomerase family protein n=1 Tax=Polynucleobacter sp. JS-Safj-400b-B2 TaxID=2576921 RepID=UPI001C0D3E85|nr:tautomerase family protein [Polynucleobacter sp. JS-Safj-400b-B2]MBU3625533.1 tautomerase family protein [Polynucleobacter sp. JS-Safj-400b-B2]